MRIPLNFHTQRLPAASTATPWGEWVGTALIESLHEATGAAWSPAAERAWKDAYATVAHAIVSEPR